MKPILLAAAAGATLAFAIPAAAQTPAQTPHHAPGDAATVSDPACPPEHAAMGHCTPKPAADPVPATMPAAADPACAPEHAAMGHCTPKPAAPPAPPAKPAAIDPACPPEHAAMGHCTPTPAAPDETVGTVLPAGKAPAPEAPVANYADRIWGAAAMAPSRDLLMSEHGGGSFSQILLDLAEVQVRNGRDGYRWEGEAWFGGDINRLTVKTEGEGGFGDAVDSAELQILYSRAIGPYFNLQAGVRHDIRPSPSRTYATLGFEGLAPYWFELEGALFLSDKGDLLGRIEGYYDQRITQRLIVQPRAEVNVSAQDVRENGLGSGVTDAELGLRLRYEIVREFAPYVGVSWERRFGDTARFARAAGEGTGGFGFVMGVRAWF